jgi:hypothetical protein
MSLLSPQQITELRMSYSGKCACGRISFIANGDILSTTWCYCVTCRKQSGAPFLPFADLEKKAVSWNQEPDIWPSSDIAERLFCKVCGSVVGMRYFVEADRVGIAIGVLDDAEGLELIPSAHIFLKDKPGWFQVPDDGAERCQEFSTAWEEILAWKNQNENTNATTSTSNPS